MPFCRYGVQLHVPAEKTSGESSSENESYTEVYAIQPCRKKNLKLRQSILISNDSSGEVELKPNLNKSIEHDHDYIYVCDCVVNFVCLGCIEKQKVIYKLQLELEGLKTENALLQRQAAKGMNVVEKFLKTDAKIRT